MKIEDYNEYYIQGSDHYLIPKDVFNELFDEMGNWRKEVKELKKRLEEWEHHLKCSKVMLDIQGQKGNYDYDEYMLGLYNGMEFIIALFETREPNYISGKDVEFTNSKTQQKEFINYLEDEYTKIQSEIEKETNNNAKYFKIERRQTITGILQKYKEIIGDKE